MNSSLRATLRPHPTGDPLDARLQAALVAGARDVLLEELLGIARNEGIDEALLQAATSNLPVTPAGLARMLAGDAGDEKLAERALERLAHLSLAHRFPDGSGWVHRWTAEGLARLDGAAHRERCVRAGRYRVWRAQNESHSIEDAVEAVRNFLAGEDFDAAVGTARICFEVYRSWQQTIGIAALASEILETLPETHPDFNFLADQEAMSHLALGATERAFRRYEKLLDRHKRLAQSDPERADYQRNLSVSHSKMGDLYSDLGQVEKAREAYQSALGIAERLAEWEPERADYQRDLWVSYIKIGDLYRAFGQVKNAREAYQGALGIAERLAQAKPARADYQRDLSVSYNKMSDQYRDLGQGGKAREAYQNALAIRARLSQSEPERADYQRDLVVALWRVAVAENLSDIKSLKRALAVLESLNADGCLATADEWMIPELKRLIENPE